MKDIIVKAVYAWFARQAVDWADQGVNILVEKIKAAEANVPGRGKGASKWELLWYGLVKEAGEEIEMHKEDIKDLVGQLVAEMNKKKLW